MARRAPKLCSCGKVHASGEACPKVAARARARKAKADANRPSARERGYDADWQKLRADWLAVYPSCCRCGGRASTVDHIVPIRLAPHRRLDPTNLQSLCTPCHSSWKQARERN